MDLLADMMTWRLELVLPGAVCGLVVGMTSTGGGALLTPGLIFLGIPPATTIGSDLLIASGMKLPSSTLVGTDLMHALVLSEAASMAQAASGQVDSSSWRPGCSWAASLASCLSAPCAQDWPAS
jgi:uncharacterized membrane protein YfcA